MENINVAEKIEELVKKISSEKDLVEKFKKDPAGTVKKLLGVEIDKDVLDKIVAGVKAKIGTDKLSGILGKIFGK